MFEWLWDNLWLKIWEGLQWLSLSVTPTWVWIVLIVMAAAWVWNKFGWQGLVGLGLLVLSFGSYRQGWRDAKAGAKPIVPIDDPKPANHPPVVVKKRSKTLMDWITNDHPE